MSALSQISNYAFPILKWPLSGMCRIALDLSLSSNLSFSVRENIIDSHESSAMYSILLDKGLKARGV